MKKDGARVMMKPVVSSQMNKGGVHMKKRLISFVLAVTIMVSVSLPAFAVKKFDTSVFSGRDDICVSYDDMTATTSVYPRADILGETYINLDSGMIFIDPGIEITAISNVPLNVFFFGFRYFGYDWADLNEIIIKIGDNRYSFSNCFTSQSVEYDSLACESITFPLKTEALPFMQDFVEHQNDEIKVRLKGDTQSFDFVLTDDMKNCFILMFNLFTSGGGTDKANMQSISEVDQVVVRKNSSTLM